MRQPLSFRALRASLVVVLLLGSCALGVSVWLDRADTIDDGVRDARNIAVVLGAQIDRSIQAIDIVLRGVQRQVDGLDIETPSGSVDFGNSQLLRRTLIGELRLLPQAFQFVVANARGEVIVSTAAWSAPELDVADRDYFRELQANDDDRLSISMPFVDHAFHEASIAFARRLDGAGGRFLGVVFVTVKRAYFGAVYKALNRLPSQAFLLTRLDGTVFFRYPDTVDRSGQTMPSGGQFLAMVQRGGGSYRGRGVFDHLIRWFSVEVLHDYPLVVAVGVPEDVILAKWRLRTAAMLAGAAAFVVIVLALLRMMARQYRDLSASEAGLAAEHDQTLKREAELRVSQAMLQDREAALRIQNERFDAALNTMSQGLVMFDRDGRLAVCNEGYRMIRRLSAEEAAPGRTLRELLAPCRDQFKSAGDLEKHIVRIHGDARTGKSHRHDLEQADGRIIAVTNDPMPNGGWVATLEDVTARRQAEAKIKALAQTDLLTGLANRTTFLEEIAKAREQLHQAGTPFNVLMLDLDRFKRVNDVFGHVAGDRLLKETARRLQMSVRAADVAARLGGDEFAIIQTPPRGFDRDGHAGPAMREDAIALANRIIELIGGPFEIGSEQLCVGTSIGIAMAPGDGIEPDDLMKKADLALYRSKSEGRNGYSFFERGMAEESEHRQQLTRDLRTALERNEFDLYYQAQVDVATRRACGMEALVRWHHPDHGLITPDRFLSLAEDNGLVSALGEWVLQTACAAAADWPEDVKLAVNLSPVQFRRANLFDLIICALVDSGLPAQRLEIEITERLLLENDADHLSTLHQLRNLGVSVVLDDFGAGQSSLGYIKMFPFDKIKLDGSLTQEMLVRSESAAIACGVVNIARSLDIVTAAEEVETEAQLDAIRLLGVDRAQGYLFGHPQPGPKVSFGPVDRGAQAAASHR